MQTPFIPISGLGADWRVPGAYAEILFAQGPASAAASAREVCLVMPMLSTGTWTAGIMYPVGDTATAETGAGSGSPLHRAARMFLQANKNAKLWAVPVAASTGGSPVAATATVTYASNATGQGATVVTVAGEDCSYSFKSGDTPTIIGDGIAAAINAATWLPVTATNASGTVTLVAKLVGASQGTASLGVIRLRATIKSGVGTTVTTSGAFLGTAVAGADGSTTEAAQLATALANIANIRKYFLVVSAVDATSLSNLHTHILTKSAPRNGLRSVGVSAYTGTLANAQTLAVARNYERLRIGWQKNSEHDAAEIAANLAAVLQAEEEVDKTFCFNGFRGDQRVRWLLKPANSTADYPSGDDQNDAINSGLTTIASDSSGSYIVMSCCTRSKNAAGTVNDFRATETKQVSETDAFTDEELLDWALNDATKKFRDDERLADGTVNPNQKLVRNVLTPSQKVGRIKKRMDDHYADGQLQDVQASKDSIRSIKNGSRLEIGFDLHVIDWANQLTERIAEVSTG